MSLDLYKKTKMKVGRQKVNESVTTMKNYDFLPMFQIKVSSLTQNKGKARSLWSEMLQIHHKYISTHSLHGYPETTHQGKYSWGKENVHNFKICWLKDECGADNRRPGIPGSFIMARSEGARWPVNLMVLMTTVVSRIILPPSSMFYFPKSMSSGWQTH